MNSLAGYFVNVFERERLLLYVKDTETVALYLDLIIGTKHTEY